MKTKIFSAVVSLVTLLFLVAAIELALRAYGLGDPVVYNTNLTFRYYPVPDQKKSRLDGAHVSINDRSLRATRNWSENARFKILFFGDSVTYGGSYIDDRQLFSELVCEKLNTPAAPEYLCGNAGVNAYGTDNIANRIVYDGIDDESVIVVTLIGGDAFRSLQNLSALPFFMKSPGFLAATQELVLHAGFSVLNGLRDRPAGGEAATETEAARASLLNLKRVLLEQAQRGKSIVLVVSPSKGEVIAGKPDPTTALVQTVFAGEPHIRVVSMIDRVPKADVDAVFYDDAHLAKAGHALYAESIADVVKAMARRN